MSRQSYNRDSFWRLYQIGGPELALRYAELASSSSAESHTTSDESAGRLEILTLRFYAAGARPPEAAERQFASRFPRSSTQRVYFQLDLKNPWQYISDEFELLARYYKPDGSVMGEIHDQIATKPEWQTFWHTRGWGWDEAGHWPPGTYRVAISIDGEYRLSGEFTIFEDRAADRFSFRPSSLLGSSPWQSDDGSSWLMPRLASSLDPDQTTKGEAPGNEPAPQGLGFAGWLNKLNRQFPGLGTSEQFDTGRPLDDMAKLRWLMAIDQRSMSMLPRTMVGLANDQVLQDLLDIVDDYQKLLRAGLPSYPYYTEADVRGKIADTLSSAGRVCETLRDYRQASQHYSAAAEIYTALGKRAEAQRCRDHLTRIKFAEEGDVDAEIKRLRAELATLPAESVAYAEKLIELGGLYSSNGDDYEAEQLLLQAEGLLDKNAGDPSGRDLGAALTQSLLSIMQGQHSGGPTPIETMMKVNGLYRELSLALARIYETSNPTAAARYRSKAAQRDSRATNDEFSEYMRRALEGDLGKL